MQVLIAVMATLLLTVPISATFYGATARIPTTTITAAQNQKAVKAQYPWPEIRAVPTFVHKPPISAPTLVLTKSIGLTMHLSNQPVETSTLVQFSPSRSAVVQNRRSTPNEAGGISLGCSEWRCWPRSVVAGVTAAVVICTIAVGYVICCLFDFPGLRRKHSKSRYRPSRKSKLHFKNQPLSVLELEGRELTLVRSCRTLCIRVCGNDDNFEKSTNQSVWCDCQRSTEQASQR